ncbi:auxin-responsive protein IAA10-like isoform X2 [Ananas comosus]|uniref:Auxin-responsive protein n=1 Tax=Ananas comosus TaxID=4615 RepID=A0A6P5EE50_ANACO|nr:auxin-responsive protein IAA10-like isoform X2 [Ananas comosus]
MRRASGFVGGGAASVGSATAVAPVATGEEAAEERRGEEVEEREGGEEEEEEEEEDEEELELGLSLGAKKKVSSGRGAKWAPRGQGCRILTAKDFPPTAPPRRASPLSSPNSSVSSSSSSSAALAGAGSKRAAAADPVSPEGVGSAHPPSQMVVGWPPIRAFRMNSLFNLSKESNSELDTSNPKKTTNNNSSGGSSSRNGNNMKSSNGVEDPVKKGPATRNSLFVKVNMVGDPIGRKVDLSAHHSYESLAVSLELMFHKPTTDLGVSIHGLNALKLLDASSEFELTYKDKDGDWMMVGDVPWRLFLNSVERLRIVRRSETSGHAAPRFQPGDLKS